MTSILQDWFQKYDYELRFTGWLHYTSIVIACSLQLAHLGCHGAPDNDSLLVSLYLEFYVEYKE